MANGLDIHSSGDSMFGEVEQLPNQSTTLDDLEITAQSVNTNSVGTGVQTLAIKVNNTKIKSTEGNISLKGISGDEVDGGESNLQGIFIEANSTLVAERNIQQGMQAMETIKLSQKPIIGKMVVVRQRHLM